MFKLTKRLFVFSLGLALVITTRGATLTITPSITSNSYPGTIGLDISGLTNSEPVTIQTFLDLNGNGAVDPGDALIDSFNISDGGAMIIGGITNSNVPFDSNPASGVISVSLRFAPPAIMENLVGRHLLRVISPTGRFSPVTATLDVTNASSALTISGIVYSNGLVPVPNAVVVAMPPSGGYSGSVVSDSNGHYSLSLPPGAYYLIPTFPNYFCDQAITPTAVLTNGISVTNNLFLTNGTVSISGNVYDAANSNGVGGLMLQMQSGNLFGIAFTDPSGNYTSAVSPNFWKIKPLKERLPRRAYVTPQNSPQANTTTGNATNVNLSLFKANAIFYGRIADNSNAPLANIEIDGGDGMNNMYSAKGVSDANGSYVVAVLGGVSGDWGASPSSGNNDALANYVINEFSNTNIFVGQAIQQNYVALPVTAHISGQIRDNTGNLVANAILYASGLNSGNNYQSRNVSTDSSGNYSLGVASGNWQVNFSNGGEDGLDTLGFADYSWPHNVSIPPTNVLLNLTVYQVGTPLLSQPQRMSPTQFSFSINGQVGSYCTVQTTTNLASTNWVNLYTLQLTNSPFFITDPGATNKSRFYRVQKN